MQPRRRFVLILAVALAFLSVLPFLFALMNTPHGGHYLGFQFGTDDEMVYAAWMRQAMGGHFFFDNRFAIDPQPGLTIHLYFWVLGILAKLTGIAGAAAIARAVFAYLFVWLLARLVTLFTAREGTFRLAMVLACFGAGIGFLAWQPLGQDFYASTENPLKGLLLGHLPNDVWQPEGFVFPSILTNSLFSASLCLIAGILFCVLKAETSWKPVLPGALGMLVLMNVHSYDVLLIALVLAGVLVGEAVRRQITVAWVVRALSIGAGAIPSALWFEYVLGHDAVFQSRAATLTFTENFRSVSGGYVLFMLVAGAGAILWIRRQGAGRKLLAGLCGFALLVITLFLACVGQTGTGYWMSTPTWILVFAVALVLVALLSRPNPAQNLILSWAVVGLVAPYFPGLFERKLMMGLSIPWALLAAAGLGQLLGGLKLSEKKLVAGLAAVVLCATSIRWLAREFQLIAANDSNTTVQPVYLSANDAQVVEYLNERVGGKRTVVLAMPGIPLNREALVTPLYPDLNPIISGLTGAYTYAGHWSETPDYYRRRSESTSFFLKMSLAERKALLARIGASYVVAPVPELLAKATNGAIQLQDVRDLGEVVVDGPETRLIRITGVAKL